MLSDLRNMRARTPLAHPQTHHTKRRRIWTSGIAIALCSSLSAPVDAQTGDTPSQVRLQLKSLAYPVDAEVIYGLSSGSGSTATNVSVATQAGSGTRTFLVTHQGTLQITQTDAPNLHLENINCEGAVASTDLASRKVVLAIVSEDAVSCTFANSTTVASGATADQTATLTQQTLQRTATSIAGSLPATSNRVTERLSASMVRKIPVPKATDQPSNEESQRTSSLQIPLTGSADGNAGNAKFSTALSDLADAKAREQGEKIRDSGLNLQGITVARSRFDGWIEGNAGYVRDSQNNTSDAFSNLALGADYRLNERWLLGMMGTYNNIDSETVASAPDISGKGWMAGPYAGYKINRQMFVSLKALRGVGETKYFASPDSTLTADGLETNRWLLDATVSGNLKSGNWTLSPTAQFSHFAEQGHQVATGASTIQAKADSERFLVGPQISYEFAPSQSTRVTPRAAVKALWQTEDISIDDEAIGDLKNESLSARVEAGIAVTSPEAKLDFSGSLEGLGGDETSKAATGKATLSVPLN